MQLVINIICYSKIETYMLKCNNNDNSQEMSIYNYKKYEKSYAKIDDANKWVFTIRTVVKDAFYNFGLHCKYE